MALRIRAATSADADVIAALHLASYRAAYQGLIPAEVLASLRAEDRRRRWQAGLNDPQRHTLIAHDAGGEPAVIGFVEVGPSRDDDAVAGTGELMALHVMQSRWRQGAGRALHDAAVATLADRGFQAATLWVLSGNTRAQAFYEAMGWLTTGLPASTSHGAYGSPRSATAPRGWTIRFRGTYHPSFDTAPDLVSAQPQIIYIDTPHDGFGPMGEIQPR